MSIRKRVFAAAATLTLAGSLAAVAGTAGAATPSCGHDCLDLFSRDFGTHHHPNFVLDVQRQAARVGQPIILYRTTNSDPAEDFPAELNGTAVDVLRRGPRVVGGGAALRVLPARSSAGPGRADRVRSRA